MSARFKRLCVAVAPFNPLHTTHTAGGGLHVALVHDWLTVPAGSEDVFREICDLYPGHVFTSQWDSDRVRFVEHLGVTTGFVNRLPLAKRKHYLYAPVLPYTYRSFDLDGFDVVLSDSHSFAHGVRKRPGGLHINYYHTPARSLWLPEIDDRASSGALAPVKRLVAKRLKKLDLQSSQNADVVIANSRNTAERIRLFYRREVDAVIYPPVDTGKYGGVVRASDDLGYLIWGRLIPYKRVDLAIEAVKKTGHRLQVVGSGPLERQLKEQACGHRNIEFHGRLPDSELMSLMSRCRGVLFPGYEDFGIVPVEAMSAGLPVIAYGAGGAGETVTHGCGELFERQTVESLSQAIIQSEARTYDPQVLRTRALEFDRLRFRREYATLVEQAIERHFSTGIRRRVYVA